MDSIIFKEGSVSIPDKAFSLPLINTLPYLEWELPEPVVKSLTAFKTFFLQNKIKNVNYDKSFAEYLTEELSPYLNPILKFDETSPFDWQSQNPSQYNIWCLEGVSPVFEYYTLQEYDSLKPHYDNTEFVNNDTYVRTLMSGVIFLDDHHTSAHTLLDSQLLVENQDIESLEESPTSIISWALPQKGKVIVYPSKLCHSVLPALKTSSSFIKFKIYYNAINKE